MPKVHFGKEVHEVEDELYESFLGLCLVEGVFTVTGFLESLNISRRRTLESYIMHRLAEVDPGYIKKVTNA